eukprot:1242194-Amphidinium_carterae.1
MNLCSSSELSPLRMRVKSPEEKHGDTTKRLALLPRPCFTAKKGQKCSQFSLVPVFGALQTQGNAELTVNLLLTAHHFSKLLRNFALANSAQGLDRLGWATTYCQCSL